MDEQERAAHLGRAWDTFKRDDLMRCDPGDVAMIRSLIALDRQPMLDPRFAGRLETALMRPGAVLGQPSHAWPLAPVQVPGSVDDARDVWNLPEWGRRPSWSRWTAAGIVVFFCGALVFLTLQTGGNDESGTAFLPAYGDASVAANAWQETAACDVPARSGDSFRTLLALSAGDMTPTPPPGEMGTTANTSTVAAIEATVRELVSCHNARQPARYYALWTDTAILWADRIIGDPQDGGLLQSILDSMEYVEGLEGTPEPVRSDQTWTVEGVEDVQILSDGRIRATVRYGTPGGESTVVTHFDQRDGAYLLDAAAGWTYDESTAGQPWSNLLATPDSTEEAGSARANVTSGDTGSDVMGADAEGPAATTGATSTNRYPTVPSEHLNPGDTSAGTAIGGPTVSSMASRPAPTQSVSPDPGNTSGGSAIGGLPNGVFSPPATSTPRETND